MRILAIKKIKSLVRSVVINGKMDKKEDIFDDLNPDRNDFDLDLDLNVPKPEPAIADEKLKDGMVADLPKKEELPRMYITNPQTVKRRVFSEESLFKMLNYEGEFKEGSAYHFLTAGDIDIFSFFKYIMKIRRFENVLISTWCLARQELLEIKKMLDDKMIKKFHLCLGEIFKGSYLDEYLLLKDLQKKKYKIKITVFRNHAKVMLAYSKPDYYFVLESSANLNTNPRTEQTTIFVDKGLYNFYLDYFNGIRSFE